MGIDYEYLHDVETRATDADTGGQKGVKLTQVGALDPVALIEVGRVAGMGANKYSAFNYLNGFDWAHAYNAMQRHANLFWSGEDRDAESGLPHIAHAAWMALALLSFYLRSIGTDSRPPRLCTSVTDNATVPLLVKSEDALTPEAAQAWLNAFYGGNVGWKPLITKEEWGTGDGPIYDETERTEFVGLRADEDSVIILQELLKGADTAMRVDCAGPRVAFAVLGWFVFPRGSMVDAPNIEHVA